MASIKDRLLKLIKIDTKTGCWLWQGSVRGYGYGCFTVGSRKDNSRRNVQAHRVCYEVFVGEIPKGNVLLHSCDRPACINPFHLTPGTHKDNWDDMNKKGRARTDGLINWSKA
jgi:hypothetical protein